ncbi:MAG: hypothetical protein HGB32_14435 [Geobacteraceae bacterium]|nr:hypothetical protein [Geobacteraceae bacterium]NTW81324.1 hypothetical protein [Geobacteraceae bacterium]
MIQYRNLFALILLVISLALTNGAGATVELLLQEEAASPCCVADTERSDSPLEVPCSDPDCQCIFCLAFVMPLYSRQPANNNFHATSSFNTLVKTPPIEYFKAIDYPPELS